MQNRQPDYRHISPQKAALIEKRANTELPEIDDLKFILATTHRTSRADFPEINDAVRSDNRYFE